MKRWSISNYWQMTDNDGELFYTEQQILDEYWDYWCEQMQRVGRMHLISRENCIGDWVVVNWAQEVNYGKA